ncbi:aldehyde dehydrogenase family protein [Pigmentiphaga soli]|uniref:Aldehyde dehydrogenase family protein n=1 Tax=Pigmentiphaga soli TaxID=1007095 RepID=A0ABP8H8N1_9BURK
MDTAEHYINGRWLSAIDGPGRFGIAVDPATGEPAARFAEGGAAEACAAVDAASRAFAATAWAHSPRLRAEVLTGFAQRLEARADRVADALVRLNGKLRREARAEVAAGVSELHYYAGLARNLFGRVLEVEPGCFSSLEREPAGVAVAIVPWNGPVTLLIRSLAPAMAAGCASIVKPASQTAWVTRLVLEALFEDTRVAPGIVNVVVESGADAARALCASPQVDVISFTGSTAVGKSIAAAASQTLARLSLELGGKAPGIVFDDCDLDATVAGVAAGALILAGQQCTALSRVLVQDSVYDSFAPRLAAALRAVRVGPGMDPASGMGSLIDVRNRDRIDALVAQAERSERVLVRGRVPGGALARGAFIEPSLVEVEDLQSRFVQEELFGPLLVIERFADEADALRRANATSYGLAASVWTRDALKARRVAGRLRFGTVWANAHNKLFPEAETGGHHASGYGRLHGVEGLNDFLATKHYYFEQ